MPTPEADTDARLVIDALLLGRNEARRRFQFHGRRLERLRDVLLSDTPDLIAEVRFSLVDGRVAVQGQLTGSVELTCQRCLKSMQYPLNESFALLISGAVPVVRGDSAEDLETEYQSSEWEEWIADASELDVSSLVEEQVLLAVPLIPRHENPQHCGFIDAAVSEQGFSPGDAKGKASQRAYGPEASDAAPRRPFANLRELLKK